MPAPILPHVVEVPNGEPLTIYARTEAINYFLNGDLEPATEDGAEVRQYSTSGFSRRRYPGDTRAISVEGSDREFVYDPTSSYGPSLPGKSFTLRQTDGPKEKRQFTYKGRYIDLHAFISAEAAVPLRLQGPGRRSVKIQPAATP